MARVLVGRRLAPRHAGMTGRRLSINAYVQELARKLGPGPDMAVVHSLEALELNASNSLFAVGCATQFLAMAPQRTGRAAELTSCGATSRASPLPRSHSRLRRE